MSEAATGSERRFDATVYSPAPSADPSAADRNPPRAVEQSGDPYPEVASQIKLGVAKQETNSYAEAEEYFRRALEIGDRTFGAEHPDMIILLNDLTRLYLKQGSYAAAEPLLLRLLDLKKSKGEDHPEVATVLASLATVRQSLGRHESAEQLWRHVVDIRERTLAPNHFATATALERLGESCAARGKIRAALGAFERALTIRERTLGHEHPSLRTSRERIADLQLQGSDDSFYSDEGIEQLSTPPERFRLSSGEPAVPTRPPTPRQDRTEKEVTPPDRTSTLVIPRKVTDDEAGENPEPNGDDVFEGDVEALQLSTVSYRDALESVRQEIEGPSEKPRLWSRAEALVGLAVTSLRTRRVAGAIAITGVAVLLVGMAAVTRASGAGDRGTSVLPSSTTGEPSAIALPVTRNLAPNPIESVNVSVPVASVHKPAPAPSRVAETHTPARKAAEKIQQSIAIPEVSTAMMARLDSVATRTGNAPARGIDAFAVQAALPLNTGSRTTFSDEPVESPQHARLIGELPKPTVPYQLANVEGEVRIRFTVDAEGRPLLSSLSIVSSSHPALTDAVKRVIPSMRFEPARTGGPSPKTVAELVQVSFVFSSRGQ